MKKIFFLSLITLFGIATLHSKLVAQERDDTYYLILAQEAYNNRMAEETKEYSLSALEKNPQNDAAYYLLAKVSIVENNSAAAEKFLKQAITCDSSNYYYYNMLGAVLLQNGKREEAVELYKSGVALFPQKKEAYVNLIDIYGSSGEYDKILSLADDLENAVGPNEVSLMARYNIYSGRRDWENAFKCLEEAERIAPSPRYETLLGDMLSHRREDSLALEYYEKALTDDPLYAPALYGAAEIARLRKEYKTFFPLLQDFMSISEITPELKLEYAGQLLSEPLYFKSYGKEMSIALRNMGNAHPTDTTANFLAAMFMTQVGETQMADSLLRALLRNTREDYNVRFNYISFLYSTNQWAQLQGFIDTTLTLYPARQKNLLQLKAIAEFNQKEYDAALSTMLRCEPLAKKERDTLMLLSVYSFAGDILHKKKSDAVAYKYYKKALKLSPRYAPVLNNYAWYLATSEDNAQLSKALEMSKITVEDEPSNSTYLDTYAYILYKMGDLSAARKYQQLAVAYSDEGDNVTLLEHYADILFALKEYDLSFLYYDKAVKAARRAEESGDSDEEESTTAADIEKKIAERKKELAK